MKWRDHSYRLDRQVLAIPRKTDPCLVPPSQTVPGKKRTLPDLQIHKAPEYFVIATCALAVFMTKLLDGAHLEIPMFTRRLIGQLQRNLFQPSEQNKLNPVLRLRRDVFSVRQVGRYGDPGDSSAAGRRTGANSRDVAADLARWTTATRVLSAPGCTG